MLSSSDLRAPHGLRCRVPAVWHRRFGELRAALVEAQDELQSCALTLAVSNVPKGFRRRLAIWSASRAGNRPREPRPADTIPTQQELLGLMLVADRGWGDPVNVTCACVEGQSSPAACPLHARTHSESVSGSTGR